MTRTSILREIRVFVSSTFRDLEPERNHLVLDAFPRLRSECYERGVAFTEIDLRWGITDDEARAYRVLKICLEEVNFCSSFPPFFVGILGDRYGWIPESCDWENADDLEIVIPGFSKRHQGKSITELEIQFGVLERAEMREHAFFYFLKSRGSTEPKQEHLKYLIRESGAIFRENIENPEDLSDLIVSDLVAAIERLYPRKLRPKRVDQIAEAQKLHSAQLSNSYISVPGLFDEWLSNCNPHQSICVFGESGTGKSAFLAALADYITSQGNTDRVFIHHVGAGDSRTRFTWMECLYDWALKNGLTELNVPKSNSDIQAQLPILLSAIGASVAILIIIDALDQLDDGLSLEEWLPTHEVQNIRWLVSTTDKRHTLACRRLGWQIQSLPPLERVQARKLVEAGLNRYHKRLPDLMLSQCLDHPLSTRPLFLKVLYEELRLHGKHETLNANFNNLLACMTVESLFECLLSRLSRDLGQNSVNVIALIGHSRHGASEPELRGILALRTWDVRRAILMASPYFSSHQGLLSPFHESFRRALKNQTSMTNLPQIWCAYWQQSTDVRRRFQEYPSALAATGDWKNIQIWVLSQEALAFAWVNKSVDVLASWHAEIASKVEDEEGIHVKDLTDWILAALQGLKEFAYQIGNRDLEMTALMAQQKHAAVRQFQWLIDRSLLHYRRGQQSVAVQLAHQASDAATESREKLDSTMNLIQMLAFGDDPAQALEISSRIARSSASVLESDTEAEAYLCQYTSFACHFLDLNRQSKEQSQRAANLYGALGRRYDQGICWVNAGDGAWGAGDFEEAEMYFLRALELASNSHLPHVDDIATICLANLRMTQGRLSEAAELYDQGVSLAKRIGQDWDVLYGRIYQSLNFGLLGQNQGELMLLAQEASNGGYRYLFDVAQAYRLVLDEGITSSDWQQLAVSPFPGPRAYALAHATHKGKDMIFELKTLLDTTEGIKGPSDYIFKALKCQK